MSHFFCRRNFHLSVSPINPGGYVKPVNHNSRMDGFRLDYTILSMGNCNFVLFTISLPFLCNFAAERNIGGCGGAGEAIISPRATPSPPPACLVAVRSSYNTDNVSLITHSPPPRVSPFHETMDILYLCRDTFYMAASVSMLLLCVYLV